ncbi:MAG: imidazole glycerol phosphate synthase subunit HisH [Candidatus Magasanikbacteria bacterium]|jgi:imidazole glycerol-phosphate synthase subunit HisH|nr:imidazole glycerol phosphate synthase subunit HisH [Candidatus Magasanikbacteria bacterium]
MIVVVDYGMGNLHSIAKALECVGGNVLVSSKGEDIKKADKIVLPGVGAFRDGVANLKKRGLDKILISEVEKKKPLLGICLGMQLLANKSYEFGEYEGLSLIDSEVKKFNESIQLRVPHMGWNNIEILKDHVLLKGVKNNSDFYFVHSYFMECKNNEDVFAECSYGSNFPVIVAKDNIFITQFHPEKSQKNGLKILKNFAGWNM